MTSQIAIRREVQRLKEQTGTKEPRCIYITYWHPPSVPLPEDTVKIEGELITRRIECKR